MTYRQTRTALDKSILYIVGKPYICQGLAISILCFAVLFFAPGTAAGIVQDPYSVKRLALGVDFLYRDYRRHSETPFTASTFERSDFTQQYSLEVRGYLKDPRLIVYDLNIFLSGADITEYRSSGAKAPTSSEFTTRMDRYRLKTIFLRQSRIPLTLFANRRISESYLQGETTTDNYGLDWHLKLRTLPWTKLDFEKTTIQAIGRDEETTFYGIGMTKSTRNTDSAVNYSITDSMDNIKHSGSENSVITLSNSSRLPMDSLFSMGLAKNDLLTFDSNSKTERNVMAGNLELTTKPTKEFDQSYKYTFVQSDASGRSDISTDKESFTGKMRYSADTFKMLLNSNINEDKQESLSSNTTSQYQNSSAWIDYRPVERLKTELTAKSTEKKYASVSQNIVRKDNKMSAIEVYTIPLTRELSAYESIKYSLEHSRLTAGNITTGDSVTGKTERSILDVSTGLKYARQLTWALFSAGGSLGYYEERVKPATELTPGGSGVSYGLNTGLEGINLIYLTLGTNYDYSGVASDTVGRKQQTFKTNAVSSYIGYLPLSASYTYNTLDSYIDAEDGEENTVTANAGMNYLNYLPVTASYSHYTLVRPGNPPPDFDIPYLYIKEKEETTFELTTKLTYFRQTNITASYNHYDSAIDRGGSPPMDMQSVYIEEGGKEEDTFKVDADMNYLKYLPVTASYSNYTLVRPDAPPDMQYTYTKEKEETSFSLKAKLIYFRNTDISAFVARRDYTFSVVDANSSQRSESFVRWDWGIDGSHKRILFRGNLTVSAGYRKSLSETNAVANEDVISTYIRGQYDKRLTRNLAWNLRLERSNTETNGLDDILNLAETGVSYRLRQWLVSTEYTHSTREQEGIRGRNSNTTEDMFMLRVSRSFVRFF